jgi:hypothetical protein
MLWEEEMARKAKLIENMAERTEQSLFKRIEGYFYEEKTEELRKVEELDPLTGEIVKVDRPVVVKIVRKHVPPDTRSIIFAAKCLMPDKYKESHEPPISGLAEFITELEEARKRASQRHPRHTNQSRDGSADQS